MYVIGIIDNQLPAQFHFYGGNGGGGGDQQETSDE